MTANRIEWPRLRWARGLLPVLLAAALAACDVAGDGSGSQPVGAAPLAIVSSSVADGVHTGSGAVRIEFDRPLDARSVGSRSVRVARSTGRRIRRARAWATGSTLFVAPAPGREFPSGTDLLIRVEGGGSPRALRASDGAVLPERFEARFRTLRRRRLDLTAPGLVGSLPESGARGVAPGSHVQLIFDEPLSRASIRSGNSVVLRVNGRERAARVRVSPDLMRLVVRPIRPVPPGARVEVDVRPALLDIAGNPARHAVVEFHVEATRLHEIDEDFVTTDTLDPGATTGGWSPVESPGYLVARAGRVRWSPAEGGEWDDVVPKSGSIRFQVVFPGDSAVDGAVSALRLTLVDALPGDALEAASVAVGPTTLFRADPTFDGNSGASDLHTVVELDLPLEVEVDDDGVAVVEIPFDVPVPVRRGRSLLLDIDLRVPPGVRLAATDDTGGLALVEEIGSTLLPAAELLVTGGPPQARSGWYDSGIEHPGWRAARIVAASPAGAPGYVVEFQTAAATEQGRPDIDRASEWSPDLESLPALRFVRFRVEFDGLGGTGRAPRIDRVVLPYQE